MGAQSGDEDVAREHEEGLALFIEPAWRPRFRESLASERRRAKLLRSLDHFRHLDARFALDVPHAEQRSELLIPRLRALGAPARCYLLSNDGDLDRRELPLREALAVTADAESHCSTFISFVPGRLAYFHDHEPWRALVLQRPA